METIEYIKTISDSCSPQYIDDICNLTLDLPDGCFVECGVGCGYTAAILSIVAKRQNRKLYLCDSFDGFPKADDVDKCSYISFPEGFGKGILTIEYVKSNFDKWEIDYSNVEFIKGFFCNSLPVIKENIEPIAFLHFDGDYYKSAVDVIDNLYPLMVDGSVFLVHDYPDFEGCKKAIDERFTELNYLDGSVYIRKNV